MRWLLLAFVLVVLAVINLQTSNGDTPESPTAGGSVTVLHENIIIHQDVGGTDDAYFTTTARCEHIFVAASGDTIRLGLHALAATKRGMD